MGKQKDLIPVFDINKKEPLIHDPVSGNFINSFKKMMFLFVSLTQYHQKQTPLKSLLTEVNPT